MPITVEVRGHWDRFTRQAAEITPARGHAVLLEWQIDPPPVDAGVPEELAGAIARALVDLGEVAFRWEGGRGPRTSSLTSAAHSPTAGSSCEGKSS